MGAVKICTYRRAENPYDVESIGIHLYSIEELSYFLYENIYLINEQMIDEKLYCWIEEELGLGTLAEKLRNGKTMGNYIYPQIMMILQASGYYSESELSLLSEKMKELSGMQTQERMKARGDELLRNGNYWSAVLEYEKLLTIRQSNRLTVEFYAKVWNNLASCYARLFLFEKAAGCFENAYQFQKLSEYKERAYYARKLAARGQEEEELSEAKISEEFRNQSEKFLQNLEEKAAEDCRKMTPEKFLTIKEKEYCKISCV